MAVLHQRQLALPTPFAANHGVPIDSAVVAQRSGLQQVQRARCEVTHLCRRQQRSATHGREQVADETMAAAQQHVLAAIEVLTPEVSDFEAWDNMLLEAGELSWRAGPLHKGVAFCHGSAGSAHALLKLYRRTGQSIWLERARALAMHGVQQVERDRALHGQGRHTLWTGDLGLACVLWDCITGKPAFPTLDSF